jgi:hypothetical protein
LQSELTKERFDKVLSNNISLKEYILDKLEEQNILLDDKEITTHIFKIIANKNYPYNGFRDDFKEAIQNAPVTHFVKKKINGSIHDETISKIKNEKDKGVKIRGGIARNGEYVRYDIFKIENSKGKITYDFVKITSQYYCKKLEELPTPTLKGEQKDIFMFSVYKNDLLSYNLKDCSKVVGNFVKVQSSIVIKETKNLENELFKKQLKGFDITILSSDDITHFEQMRDKILELEIIKTSKQNKTTKWGFKKLCNFEKLTTLKSQESRIIEIIEAIKNLLPNINFSFYMGKVTANTTKELKSILIKNKIIEGEDNMQQNIIFNNTIFITFNESGYLESLRSDGKTDIKDLVKLKINCMGEVVEKIISEKREVLK